MSTTCEDLLTSASLVFAVRRPLGTMKPHSALAALEVDRVNMIERKAKSVFMNVFIFCCLALFFS